MKTILCAAAAALAIATGAQASVIPILTGVTPSGSNYIFNYQAALAPDQGLTAGDRLVIVDFMGYVAGSVLSTNSDWSASVSNTLPSGLVLLPGVTDSATVPDLVFTYMGPDFQIGGGPYSAQIDYSGLSAVSTLGLVQLGSFSAEAIKNSGFTQGSVTFNVGSVAVPAGVPEPATWAMFLIGFGALGFTMRGSRRKDATVTA